MATARRPTRVRVAALAAALALGLVAGAAACGGDDDDDEAGTSPTSRDTTTTTASPPTTLTPEQEAEATYLEFVATVERLSTQDPNPDDPALARLAVDPVLSAVRDSLTTQRAEHHVWQRGDRTAHSVSGTSVGADGSVSLDDCLVENDVLIDNDDGSVVETQPLTTRTLAVTLVAQDGGWAVSRVETVAKVDGEASCGG